MAKHIQVAAELSEDKSEVKITILSQTHIASLFGDTNRLCPYYKQYGFEHDGFILFSSMFSDFYHRLNGAGGRPGAAMLGSSMERCEFTMPIAYYDKFKAAVEAYNEHFKDKD